MIECQGDCERQSYLKREVCGGIWTEEMKLS